MVDQLLSKNPISVLNCFSLRRKNCIKYEFVQEESEFVAKVLFNNSQISEGKDRKKQAAKTKAAKNAVLVLNEQILQKKPRISAELEKEIVSLLKALKIRKKSGFRLGYKDPYFIYKYFIGHQIAEGWGLTEPQARFICAEKALNVLKSMQV